MGIFERILGGKPARNTVYYVTVGGVKGMSPSQLYETQPALRSVV